MLKLLLCSAVLAPCVILPFTGSSDALGASTKISFEDAYISPELAKVKSCEAAEFDVYFHDALIELHSADYLARAVSLASKCGAASYTIKPVIAVTSDDDAFKTLQSQTNELLAILKAHNVSAKVSAPQFQPKFDSLTMNGRSLILKIDVNSNKNT